MQMDQFKYLDDYVQKNERIKNIFRKYLYRDMNEQNLIKKMCKYKINPLLKLDKRYIINILLEKKYYIIIDELFDRTDINNVPLSVQYALFNEESERYIERFKDISFLNECSRDVPITSVNAIIKILRSDTIFMHVKLDIIKKSRYFKSEEYSRCIKDIMKTNELDDELLTRFVMNEQYTASDDLFSGTYDRIYQIALKENMYQKWIDPLILSEKIQSEYLLLKYDFVHTKNINIAEKMINRFGLVQFLEHFKSYHYLDMSYMYHLFKNSGTEDWEIIYYDIAKDNVQHILSSDYKITDIKIKMLMDDSIDSRHIIRNNKDLRQLIVSHSGLIDRYIDKIDYCQVFLTMELCKYFVLNNRIPNITKCNYMCIFNTTFLNRVIEMIDNLPDNNGIRKTEAFANLAKVLSLSRDNKIKLIDTLNKLPMSPIIGELYRSVTDKEYLFENISVEREDIIVDLVKGRPKYIPNLVTEKIFRKRGMNRALKALLYKGYVFANKEIYSIIDNQTILELECYKHMNKNQIYKLLLDIDIDNDEDYKKVSRKYIEHLGPFDIKDILASNLRYETKLESLRKFEIVLPADIKFMREILVRKDIDTFCDVLKKSEIVNEDLILCILKIKRITSNKIIKKNINGIIDAYLSALQHIKQVRFRQYIKFSSVLRLKKHKILKPLFDALIDAIEYVDVDDYDKLLNLSHLPNFEKIFLKAESVREMDASVAKKYLFNYKMGSVRFLSKLSLDFSDVDVIKRVFSSYDHKDIIEVNLLKIVVNFYTIGTVLLDMNREDIILDIIDNTVGLESSIFLDMIMLDRDTFTETLLADSKYDHVLCRMCELEYIFKPDLDQIYTIIDNMPKTLDKIMLSIDTDTHYKLIPKLFEKDMRNYICIAIFKTNELSMDKDSLQTAIEAFERDGDIFDIFITELVNKKLSHVVFLDRCLELFDSDMDLSLRYYDIADKDHEKIYTFAEKFMEEFIKNDRSGYNRIVCNMFDNKLIKVKNEHMMKMCEKKNIDILNKMISYEDRTGSRYDIFNKMVLEFIKNSECKDLLSSFFSVINSDVELYKKEQRLCVICGDPTDIVYDMQSCEHVIHIHGECVNAMYSSCQKCPFCNTYIRSRPVRKYIQYC